MELNNSGNDHCLIEFKFLLLEKTALGDIYKSDAQKMASGRLLPLYSEFRLKKKNVHSATINHHDA